MLYLFDQTQSIFIRDGRLSVWHSQDHRNPAGKSRSRPRSEILLVGTSGLPKVNVDVYQAWNADEAARRYAIHVRLHFGSFAHQSQSLKKYAKARTQKLVISMHNVLLPIILLKIKQFLNCPIV